MGGFKIVASFKLVFQFCKLRVYKVFNLLTCNQ